MYLRCPEKRRYPFGVLDVHVSLGIIKNLLKSLALSRLQYFTKVMMLDFTSIFSFEEEQNIKQTCIQIDSWIE